MRILIATIAAAALISAASGAKAASFSCMELEGKTATEVRICKNPWLGNLDERMDSWYRRALVRAGYFDQTSQVRRDQLDWLAVRNTCGAGFWCIRGAYLKRIRELKNYVEHV